MKYLTKLIIADVPRAQSHPLDVEADSAEQAGIEAIEHWKTNWTGPTVNTEVVVYVHAYQPGADRADEELSFVVAWGHDDYDPDALREKQRAWELTTATKGK